MQRFAPALCGALNYQVYFNGAPVPNDWVYFSNGEIVMNPDLNTNTGTYTFELVAWNTLYTNITSSRPFTVNVLPCQTGLVMNGLSLQNQQRIWYQSPLEYSVSSVLN